MRAVDACPFCGAEAPNVTERTVTRRSRAAVFATISLMGVACGARTDLGGIGAGDASDTADTSSPDATPECVGWGGDCTESSQCCPSMICLGEACSAPGVFYGGPFPRNDE